MPLLRFKEFTGKVRSHEKTCTFRRPRKNPLEESDDLHIYVLEKLGMGTLTDITPTTLREITEEQAIMDGFRSVVDAQLKLMRMHKLKRIDEEFNFIEFKPHWRPNKITYLWKDY